MNCPICDSELKEFQYKVGNEEIKQCKYCNFHYHIQMGFLMIRIKDHYFKINYDVRFFNKTKERRILYKINRLVNFYRKKNRKDKILFFPRLKKYCSKCKELKHLKYFHKENNNLDLHANYCKLCAKDCWQEYSLTFEGWLSNAYHTLKIHQKKRFVNEIHFTKDDLRDWIDKDLFNNLWEDYVNSNYSKKFQVCLYRKDYNKDYNLNNLQLISHKDMMQDVVFKINFKKQNKRNFAKSVIQLKDGKIIKIWDSIREAERELNCFGSNISKVCKGKYKTHHGFEWRYI